MGSLLMMIISRLFWLWSEKQAWEESYHLATMTLSFLGKSSSAYFSNSGYCSMMFLRIPRAADDFTWLFELMFSLGKNLELTRKESERTS